jgi:hypothetical protein
MAALASSRDTPVNSLTWAMAFSSTFGAIVTDSLPSYQAQRSIDARKCGVYGLPPLFAMAGDDQAEITTRFRGSGAVSYWY